MVMVDMILELGNVITDSVATLIVLIYNTGIQLARTLILSIM